MDPGAIVERVLKLPPVAYVMAVLDVYGRAAGGLLANGLAFAALFASVPIALLTLGFAGLLVGDPEAQAELADLLSKAFPPLADLIDDALASISAGAGVTSIIGLVGTVWTVSQFYGALDVAFARIYADRPERDMVGRTARGFVWVVLLLGGVILLIVLATLSTFLGSVLPNVPGGRSLGDLLTSWPVLTVGAAIVLVVIYRTLPPRPPRWRSLLLPAVIAGVVVAALSQVFVFLVPRLVGVAAIAGSLATAFIALAWLSFTFQVVLYGAAWVRVRDEGVDGVKPVAVAAATPDGSAPDPQPTDAGSGGLGGPAAPAEPGGGGE